MEGELLTTVVRYWWTSLALGAVVIAVVALLLHALTVSAERVRSETAAIWTTGKQIANNTIHIPMLAGVNRRLARVAAAVTAATEATRVIHDAVVPGVKEA